jgi:tyrosinase
LQTHPLTYGTKLERHPNSWLTLESPLDPFKKDERGRERAYTSLDCVNIEKQLGYTYGPGSLEDRVEREASLPDASTKVIRVSGINRARIRGSFMISAYATIDGKKYLLGTEAVLSRWNVQGCANCQTHLETKAFISLHSFPEVMVEGLMKEDAYNVEVRTRDGLLRVAQPLTLATFANKPFRFEIL